MKKLFPAVAGTLLAVLFSEPTIAETTTGPATTLPFVVATDTTYVTEPLNPDGSVDYINALNRVMSAKVDPAGNAAIPLLSVFPQPRNDWDAETQKELLRRFHLAAAECRPFVPLEGYLRVQPEYQKLAAPFDGIVHDEDAARLAPWGGDQFPAVARWLVANGPALGVVVEASRRPAFYMPLVPRKVNRPVLAGSLNFGLTTVHDFIAALITRAMLETRQKQTDLAVLDVEAAARLSALTAQRPILMDQLIAETGRTRFGRAVVTLVSSHRLDDHQMRQLLQLSQTTPTPDVVASLDTGERFYQLSQMQDMALGDLASGVQSASMAKVAAQFGFFNCVFDLGDLKQVDWSVAMRRVNRGMDQIVAAASLPTYAARSSAFEKLRADFAAFHAPENFFDMLGQTLFGEKNSAQSQKDFVKSVEKYLKRRDAESVEAYSNRMAVFFTGSPEPYQSSCRMADSVKAGRALTETALAIGLYRSTHGALPDSLDALVPAFLPAVPNDAFTDQPLIYRPNGVKYLLYSAGPELQNRGLNMHPPEDHTGLVIHGD